MTPMMEFSMFIFDTVAAFLKSEPIIYIVGLVCFCFIVKAIKILISNE